ncbi:TRAP transporter small permease [Fulvimarina sp. 2208YS6-2-32]|uniref:TRAP transporter small permease protein n=1 Tax=Fulvimarina uroteuthidis TaxID=3098149 RepID=A0ABU5I6R0_9HYPH|nr:TRAP transporter small permease [Fulvimarina sp. 2208YS6-2-32]MDY8110499.1 TRAP transporter small permease [Fulvimarina sp. 2208YS6-2-32]
MVEHEPTGPVDRLSFTFSRVTMWGPAFIVCIMFYEVVMRYMFQAPTLWVNELSLWAAGAVYVTAGLYSMQQRSHIRIFVLYDMAPLWLRRIFDVISTLCVAIFFIAVLWGAFGEALAKFWRWEAFGTAWDPPLPATIKPLVLITLFLVSLQAFSNLIRDWPASPAVRKTFDVVCGILIIGLCLAALPFVLDVAGEGSSVPMVWRIVLCALLVISVVLCLVGLVRDFNTTPEPIVEEYDPLEDLGLADARNDAPGEVLAGRPPPVDEAAGGVDPMRDPRPSERSVKQ